VSDKPEQREQHVDAAPEKAADLELPSESAEDVVGGARRLPTGPDVGHKKK
jgi:hypothetical protein